MSRWKDLEETLVNASIEVHADGMELRQELGTTGLSDVQEGKDLLDQYTAVLGALNTCLGIVKSQKNLS